MKLVKGIGKKLVLQMTHTHTHAAILLALEAYL